MAAGCSSKPLQGKLLAGMRNEVMGTNEADFNAYRRNHAAALEKYGLCGDQEKDLCGAQLAGVC